MINPSVTAVGSPPLSLLVDARALEVSGLGRYLREILGRILDDSRFAPVTLAGPAASPEPRPHGHCCVRDVGYMGM
jgi:hypothetical protein